MYSATPMDMLEKHNIKQVHKDKKEKNDSSISTRVAQEGHKNYNLNLEGAYLHVLGDALQSIGVIIGGAAIWYVYNLLNMKFANYFNI